MQRNPHASALHLFSNDLPGPIDTAAVTNKSETKELENENKSLIPKSRVPQSYNPTKMECIALRALRFAASLTTHVVIVRRPKHHGRNGPLSVVLGPLWRRLEPI